MRKITFRFSLMLTLLVGVSGCSSDIEEEDNSKVANNLRLGSSANDLLSDERFTSLQIEVGYVPGSEPSEAALEEMLVFLKKYIHKPEGIDLVKTAIPSPGGGPYAISDIIKIEEEHRTSYNQGNELAVFIFFADGRSGAEEEQKTILGTAYRNTSMVIFEHSIRKLAINASLVSKSEITSTTLQHEFGHLFGLVDNGSPAQSDHHDKENGAHCNVPGCLMEASVEFGKGAMQFIKSRKSQDNSLDEKCHLDLLANGGK